MNRDAFIVFILGVIFIGICFVVFLQYLNMQISIDVLANPSDVVINNYYVREDNINAKKVGKTK